MLSAVVPEPEDACDSLQHLLERRSRGPVTGFWFRGLSWGWTLCTCHCFTGDTAASGLVTILFIFRERGDFWSPGRQGGERTPVVTVVGQRWHIRITWLTFLLPELCHTAARPREEASGGG